MIGRIGIFGGSFNPVHEGHVQLATKVQEIMHFEPLWIVPNKTPPHKESFSVKAEHRLKMVKLAFEKVPNTEVSSFELESKDKSYAIYTLEHFAKTAKEAFFILGADAFKDLPKWYRFPELLNVSSYLVVKRKGPEEWLTQLEEAVEQMQRQKLLRELDPESPFSRSFRTPGGKKVHFWDVDLPDVSSQQIRERLASGASIAGMLPEAVARYLKTQKLYGTSKI